MAAPIKMDELLVSWLGSDEVYENVSSLIEKYREQQRQRKHQADNISPPGSPKQQEETKEKIEAAGSTAPTSPRGVVIPPFYPLRTPTGNTIQRRRQLPRQSETWDPLPAKSSASESEATRALEETEGDNGGVICVRDQLLNMLQELDISTSQGNVVSFSLDSFVRVTKEVCRFPSFFNAPLYDRILELWNSQHPSLTSPNVTLSILEWFWKTEMEPFDPPERFFRLVKQPDQDCILKDDFLPYIKALLNDHPGLEFLSNHAEFQEKYAVTVITRIFYSVNKCHSGRITSRQVRRSDLLEAFSLVDEEEDINKVTRYFSYEHFYVLYCRFWELDHDRDYRITREDLLKYGDHSLSHMVVDRIFDAAPRPFEQERVNREYLSYEDFIFFMLSEEDKANEVSVRYWFSCVDVDGDGKLNNMEMRSFYAVQLHRMQCMGHEIVPFEDMLCQMMDMIKPTSTEHLVVEDFLQSECSQVSGALFDALFNLNKYLMFEQRDPFVERQKREDEFETDWDRFACIDYNRLAMEEEAREEEAMEIDWVTVDEEEDEEGADFSGPVTTEAPF
eukprot:CAMPEP_0117075766 /NCGR_PEP_ID=MMETSP0472-20121206/53419_1 /TAXON_ID=693140 ORGANISM="Tiarina fusus, Strain LIS" /NCGR_SAMPLE_ID=MMETSP0472 /ASSEMBLY_ACC=CAM_ASM_000603 /LENGTH=561 /DNA_ID=CAMNT_0004801409 /DNA_START=79 /DNA_END=1764 /DNA_ORIENTATION=+